MCLQDIARVSIAGGIGRFGPDLGDADGLREDCGRGQLPNVEIGGEDPD